MPGYYARKLSGRRLQRCYEIASPRIVQYLESEIVHVQERLRPTDSALELGCGYGRVTRRMAEIASEVTGIDTAEENLALARELEPSGSRCRYLLMDASDMTFPDGLFDAVVCIQNGICAFGVDRETLLREALRVARPGGTVLFSTYADRFWPERLDWFEAQAVEGLLGPLDREASVDGVIVCKDGFRSGRLGPEEFHRLCEKLGVEPVLTEVDGSSLFCEIRKAAS
jgi:2-polyprenyl-6-hydroxyphenyl methylase/3-demethylubiquinone-9 3-methyltransferase